MVPNRFAGLAALRRRLDASGSFPVSHEQGYAWMAKFAWRAGATEDRLNTLQSQSVVELPRSYSDFLRESDGAVLFFDEQYSQWGYRLYGTDDIAEKQRYWSRIFAWDWSPTFLVFGESLGDADIMLFDTRHPTRDGMDAAVLDGESGRTPSQWRWMAPGFVVWLERLIVAQGAKYWRWWVDPTEIEMARTVPQ
jgi:hypothetical protein